MALQKQLISIPFAEGLDTKTDPKKTPAAKLTVAENVVFEKAGMLSRRRGHRELSRSIEGSTRSISACEAIASYNDELLCFTGSSVYSYSAATERWVDKGRAAACTVDESDVVRNTYEQKNADVAEAGGLRCVAWEDSRGGVRYSVLDSTTGTVHVGDALVASAASRPRVVSFTGFAGSVDFAIFYADGVNLRYRRVNVVTPTVLGTAQNPVTTMHATENHFDVCAIGERLFIAFNTAANTITHTYLTNAWAVSGVTSTIAPTAGNPQCLSLHADDDQNVWTSVGTSASVDVMRHSYNLAPTAAFPVSVELVSAVRITGVWWASLAQSVVFYELAGATASQARVRGGAISASGSGSGSGLSIKRSVGLIGEAVADGDRVLIPTAHDSPLQSTYFLVEIDSATITPVVIARVAYGQAGGLRSTSTVSNVLVGSTVDATGAEVDGRFAIATHRKNPLESEAGGTFTRLGCNLTSFDLATRARFLNVEAGGTLLIAGGVMQMYDGAAVTEHGYLLDPEWVTDPVLVAGGGALSAGTYGYQLVYERTDRTGRILRSAPSIMKSIVVAAGDRVTLTLPTLRLTAASDVRLVVYRTLANGEVAYRVTSATSPTLNDTTVDSVSYTDGAADATIETQELLYTTGDILPSIEPDACAAICERAGRVYVAGFADENALQYSKQVFESEPVAFAAEFRQQLAETGGAITALAAMDDKTLVFKSGAVFVHGGDGPNDAGEQSDFGDARIVAIDVGCVDSASVCTTPMGVFFKSAKGFYLVDRGLGVTYIGAPIEDWNAYAVTGAALVPGTNRVVFVTGDGPALVYDYFAQQWATFTGHESVGCTVWRGQFVMARSDGRVFVADSTKHSDGDHPYRLRVVRAWLSFAGMAGFQRLYEFAVLGEYKGGHKLRVQVGYDFAEPFEEEKLWDVEAELAGPVYGFPSPYGSGTPYGGEWPLYLVRFQQGKQLCTSFRISVEEVQTGNYNEALSLSELALVVGVERGLYRLRASRSLGTE